MRDGWTDGMRMTVPLYMYGVFRSKLLRLLKTISKEYGYIMWIVVGRTRGIKKVELINEAEKKIIRKYGRIVCFLFFS